MYLNLQHIRRRKPLLVGHIHAYRPLARDACFAKKTCYVIVKKDKESLRDTIETDVYRLNHEALDNSVEDDSVVVPVARVSAEVLDCLEQTTSTKGGHEAEKN